ncbi:serine hydrolase domain-containing protein [Kitasatospora sp. NBC_00315]|uniref:serine hydrolase domain-containing protein n=1 Tax=Kitasatospora sp. NBC_00315 TaxID=2975963 RepID=UPI003244B771
MPLPRPRLRPLLAVLAAASVLGLAPLPAQARPAQDENRLQRRLAELVGRADGPPGVIAVLRYGSHREVLHAGVAEVGSARPPQPTDHMRIASAAKAFSGAVALGLVDSGLLGLDDTLAERLPALPAAWGSVTLRQLLNHTSGLPDYSAAPEFRAIIQADPHHRFDSRCLLDFVAGQDLEFAPGSRYAYSNSDNIAVALMAEAATGRRYEDLLRTEVYRPLGLTGTTLPQGYRLPRPYLHGYAVQPPDAPEDVSTLFGASGAWASGGIVSTPDDLGRFMGAYAGGRLIAPAVRRQQLTFVDGASEPAGPGRNEAGLAIFRYTTRCGVVYGHTGNTAGYTQLAVGTPDGSRSLAFSVTSQVNQSGTPDLLAELRSVQEDFVCALLND